MAFFFFLCRIQYTFFSRVILSFFLFSFSNRYAWSSNGKAPTIYQFISIWNFFRIQLVLEQSWTLPRSKFLSGLVVSISFAFERTRVSLRSVISTSHFSRLIYYVVMWAEFTCIELLMTKKPEWKRQRKDLRSELRTKSEERRPKRFELVEIFKSASEIGIHLLDRLPEASDQSFFIIFHLQIPLQSTFEILQLMASSEIA